MMDNPEIELLYKVLKTRKIFSEVNEDMLTVHEAKINIKITDKEKGLEIFEDIISEFNFFKRGYFTMNIPKSLLVNNVHEVGDFILHLIEEDQEDIEELDEGSEEDFEEESLD